VDGSLTPTGQEKALRTDDGALLDERLEPKLPGRDRRRLLRRIVVDVRQDRGGREGRVGPIDEPGDVEAEGSAPGAGDRELQMTSERRFLTPRRVVSRR
jgi:hypothetical protein